MSTCATNSQQLGGQIDGDQQQPQQFEWQQLDVQQQQQQQDNHHHQQQQHQQLERQQRLQQQQERQQQPAASDPANWGHLDLPRLPGSKRTVAMHLAYVGTAFKGGQLSRWPCCQPSAFVFQFRFLMDCTHASTNACAHWHTCLHSNSLAHTGLQINRESARDQTVEGALELALLRAGLIAPTNFVSGAQRCAHQLASR